MALVKVGFTGTRPGTLKDERFTLLQRGSFCTKNQAHWQGSWCDSTVSFIQSTNSNGHNARYRECRDEQHRQVPLPHGAGLLVKGTRDKHANKHNVYFAGWQHSEVRG